MRLVSALTLAVLPAMTLAQSTPPPPGVGVDRITLHPGETRAFTLAPGNEHQLLVLTDPAHPAAHAITVHYDVTGGSSHITATSRTGYALGFTVLADPDGDGGFEPAGTVANLAGDGTPLTRDWPAALGTINVGDFVGGPHGDHPHAPSGG
jgi:hypothetical protein